MFESNKRLYKDVSRKKISGVLAGISDYINCDVALLRILYILLSLVSAKFAFTSVIFYLICAVIMPNKQDIYNDNNHY